MKILSIIAIFLIFYGCLECLKRKCAIRKEYTRKTAHVISALFVITLYFFVNRTEFLASTAFFIVFFTVSYSKKFLQCIHLDQQCTIGEIIYPLALFILGFFYYDQPYIMVCSIAVMGISDAASGLYNLRYKKDTFKGSLLFGGITVVILAIISSIYLPFDAWIFSKLLLVALLLAGIEHYSGYGTDNISVPIGCALFLSALL